MVSLDNRLKGTYTPYNVADTFPATFFQDSDSAMRVHRVLLVTDTLVDANGDTTIFRRPHPDTIQLGVGYDLSDRCIAGDTALIATQALVITTGPDTLAPLDSAQVDSLASALGLPNCEAATVRNRKVGGALRYLSIGLHSPVGFMDPDGWQDRIIRQDSAMGATISRTVWQPENIATNGSGGRDWERLDSVVARTHRRGMRLILYQERSPTWLVGPDETAMPGDTTEQATIDFHASLAAEAARRYPDVWAWGVWNEPNLQAFWDPVDAGYYARLYSAVFDSIRANDSDAYIVAGALSSACCVGGGDESGESFLGTFLDSVTTDVEIVSYHPYSDGGRGPEADSAFANDFNDFQDILDSLDAHGSDARLWLDEFGWTTADTSEAEKARFIGEAIDSLKERWLHRVDVAVVFISEDLSTDQPYALRDSVKDASPDATLRESGDTFVAKTVQPQ